MASTMLDLQQAIATGKYAIPYNLNEVGNIESFDPMINKYISTSYPCSGGVISSIEDMGKWMKFYATGGRDESGNVVVPEANLAFTWHGFEPLFGSTRYLGFDQSLFPAGWLNTDYGMGWVRSSYRGRDLYWHNGAVPGHMSFFAFVPSEQIGFAYLSNQNGADINSVQMVLAAIDVILHEPLWLGSADICMFPCPWYPGCTAAGAPRAERLSKQNVTGMTVDPSCTSVNQFNYEGTYSHPGFGKVTVDDSSQGLVISYGQEVTTVCKCKSQQGDTVVTQCNTPVSKVPIELTFTFSTSIFAGSTKCLFCTDRKNVIAVPAFIAPYPHLSFTRNDFILKQNWVVTQADQP